MAAQIRYRVPYECAVHAVDLASGKKVTNIFYLKSGQDAVPPAYGAPVPGPSDLATLATNFDLTWVGALKPVSLLNANYSIQDYTWRAILGKQYGTPLKPITSLVAGAPTVIAVGSPHGYSTGDTVSVSGITSPTGLNQPWMITVIDSLSFSLDGSVSGGAWSGSGTVQLAEGQLQFIYADKYVLLSIAVGSIVTDAIPLHATASIRRLSGGVGKAFRSRYSVSHIPEVSVQNGRFNVADLATWQSTHNTFLTSFPANGGTGVGSGIMFHQAVSKSKAFGLPSPFTSVDEWAQVVTSGKVQPNMGSLVRRKPRLTTPIV